MALLAHQGGWDEILLVAGPIVVILGVLVVARHRIGQLPRPAERADDRAEQLEGRPTDQPDVSR